MNARKKKIPVDTTTTTDFYNKKLNFSKYIIPAVVKIIIIEKKIVIP